MINPPLIQQSMSQDLIRQRRNLLIVSMVLIFAKFSNLEISKFSIIGIELNSFGHPETVYVVLWIVWIYILVRYYQYFTQEGFPNFKNIYLQILNCISKEKIKRLIKVKYPKSMEINADYHQLKSRNWKYFGQEDVSKSGIQGTEIRNFEMTISNKKFIKELIVSFFHVSINRSAFTDYILPLFIAIFAMFYCFKGWQGSLANAALTLVS